jgi:uncharacterized RDD family membrane protein YckC
MTAFGGAITDPTKIMGSRIGAYIVDAVLMTIVAVVLVLMIGVDTYRKVDAGSPTAAAQLCAEYQRFNTTVETGGFDGQPTELRACRVVGNEAWISDTDRTQVQLTTWAITAVLMTLNYVVLTTFTGASLGKLLFGLRVVRSDGTRAGPFANVVRTVVLLVDAFCCGIPGLISAYNSKGHRRLGDMAANTYVVHRSAEGRPLYIPGHLRGAPQPAWSAGAPVTPAGAWAPTPSIADPLIPDLRANPAGVDAPTWDQSRNAYVRYDQASGNWFQWDDRSQAWIAAVT